MSNIKITITLNTITLKQKMNKNRKCILVLVSMLLLVSILEFFEYINVSKLYNDLNDSIRDDDSDNNDIYYSDIDKDDLTSNGHIYQDEDATEEQIKLFGPLEEKEIRLNTDIFFFVTTGQDDLSCKEACLVESAARLHPYRRVFVLFITANITDVLKSFTMSILVSFNNIYLRHIDVKRYFVNPDAKRWFLNSDFHQTTDFPKYLENAITMTFLDKFGGTVTNFEYLFLRSITKLGEAAGRCNVNWLEPQPLTMNSRHPLLFDLQVALNHFYSAHSTQSIGRQMLTSVMKEKCKVNNIRDLKFKQCSKALKILEPPDFCPFPQFKHWMIVDPSYKNLVLSKLKEHKSYAIKLWTKMNNRVESWGRPDLNTPFYSLAEEKCPMVFQLCGSSGRF